MDTLHEEFGISEKWLSSLKPFYCLVDKDLNIITLGKALRKLLDTQTSMKLHQIFSTNIDLSDFQSLEKYSDTLLILQAKTLPLKIYGSVMLSEKKEHALFIMSMKISDFESLESFNLSLSDFPLSDSTIDYMISLQAAKATTIDNRKLINRLTLEKSNISAARIRLQQIVNSINISIFEISVDNTISDSWQKFMEGKIIARNKAAASTFNIPEVDDIDIRVKDILGLALKEEFEGLKELFAANFAQKTFEVKIPISTYRTMHTMTTISCRYYNGKLTTYLSIVDISKQASLQQAYTELQDTQNQLVQSNKLATLGTMAAGIAHELANPLAAAKGYCQILQKKCSQDELDKIFNKTLKSIERVETVVQNLRKLSRNTSNDEKEVFDIRKSIYDSFNTFEQPFAKLNVDVKFIFPAQKCLIFANKPDIDTVFSNLFSNTVDAYKKLRPSPTRSVKVTIQAERGKLLIEYKDNASGIPADIISKVFDPFGECSPTHFFHITVIALRYCDLMLTCELL